MVKITIDQASQFVGQTVEIGAWVTNKRSSGKIAFLQLRDGKRFFQGIVVKADVSEEVFELAKNVSQETSLIITGVIQEDTRSKAGYEVLVKDIKVVGESGEYPITPKEHGTDFLMDHRHLWLRSTRQTAIMQIRNEIIRATYEFFNKEGFIKIDAPILTGSAPEGTTELFETDYFGQPAFLSQTGQLYAEAGAMAFGKVFTFGPTFRAEKSKTRRHLTEFWMIEPEMAFTTHEESLNIQEAYVKFIIKAVIEHQQYALSILERDVELLQKYVDEPFKRVSYDEAIQLLQEKEAENDYDHIEWGEDFGSPHETFISNYYGVPTFIMNYPKEIKAFYMKPHETRDDVVICADLIAPEGYGEIIGGSERNIDYANLKEKVENFGLSLDEYGWYLDLRKFGSVPHSGFGLGLERAVAFISGIEHIREASPFPRLLNRIYP